MKNLSTKGLSMSQATSISNLCFQRASEIENKLNKINNSTKKVKINDKEHVLQQGIEIYSTIEKMLIEKGQLHATQAFLMENIKEKERLIKEKQNEKFIYNIEAPVYPEFKSYKQTPLITESWAWAQLTNKNVAEYLEAESMASHIGQFIHKNGHLSTLRNELNDIKELEWIMQPGKSEISHPVTVSVHHNPEELLKIHEQLSSLHRKYEQIVNYYKAKIKNTVSIENGRISQENANKLSDIQKENELLTKKYQGEHSEYINTRNVKEKEFEANKFNEIKNLAALKIAIEPIFQTTINLFIDSLSDNKKSE